MLIIKFNFVFDFKTSTKLSSCVLMQFECPLFLVIIEKQSFSLTLLYHHQFCLYTVKFGIGFCYVLFLCSVNYLIFVANVVVSLAGASAIWFNERFYFFRRMGTDFVLGKPFWCYIILLVSINLLENYHMLFQLRF